MMNWIKILSFNVLKPLINSSPTLISINSISVQKRVSWRFNAASNNTTHLGLHIKCPQILRDCKKITHIKFRGNPSGGSHAFAADRRKDGPTDTSNFEPNSHTPCRAHAILRRCRVFRESPRCSRKYPNCYSYSLTDRCASDNNLRGNPRRSRKNPNAGMSPKCRL
jgi:hypothetical protein